MKFDSTPQNMGETPTQQDLLRSAWLEGRTGYLSAWSEAKLWAVREVWRADKESDHGLQTLDLGKKTAHWKLLEKGKRTTQNSEGRPRVK